MALANSAGVVGSLSCSVLASDAVLADADANAAVEEAVAAEKAVVKVPETPVVAESAEAV